MVAPDQKAQVNFQSAPGYSLLEMVVALAIFGILISGVLGAYSALVKISKASRERTLMSALAAKELEVMRNMPYSQIGTAFGNPHGSLPDQTSPRQVSSEGHNYAIYFEVTYVDDAADGTILTGNDGAPNDYKQVKMTVTNTLTLSQSNFLTNVAPKGLENISNAGALLVKVLSATGQPVVGATVSIQTVGLQPAIILSRQTDAAGQVIEVGLPAAANAYHLVTSKSGYSSAQTYPITAQNPNPLPGDSTLAVGQVTQVSLSIDLVSTLTLKTMNALCQPVSGVSMHMAGSKLIGTNPDILKYQNDVVSSNGGVVLAGMEWDTYVPTVTGGANLTLLGTSPIQQISVLPGTTQVFSAIVDPTPVTTHSLLVVVKEASTGVSLEGATARLSAPGLGVDQTAITGGSAWTQRDWSLGSGQGSWISDGYYLSDDGNVDVATVPLAVRLRLTGGSYAAAGNLVSATFDTGTSSTNFTSLAWQPVSQSADTAVQFQLATNNDQSTWNFLGPDGTNATYYTTPGTVIHSSHDGNRYVRYKMFLVSSDPLKTPVVSNVTVNYVSGCNTPGQSAFVNLPAGNGYELSVAMPGYQTTILSNLHITGAQVLEVLMPAL